MTDRSGDALQSAQRTLDWMNTLTCIWCKKKMKHPPYMYCSDECRDASLADERTKRQPKGGKHDGRRGTSRTG